MYLLIISLIIIIVCLLVYIILSLDTTTTTTLSNSSLYMNSCLYVKESPIGGRGVFTSRNIKKGEILERSPYIEDDFVNFTGVTVDYVFYKTADRKRAILSFGYSAMYNHSDSPSAVWKINDDGITISAIKDINKGDEIFVSYGSDYWTSRQAVKTKKDVSDL